MKPQEGDSRASLKTKEYDFMTQTICTCMCPRSRRTKDNVVATFVCTYQVKYWECVIIEEHSNASSTSITMNNRRKLYPPDAFPVSAKRRRKACCDIPPSNVARSVPHHLKYSSIWSVCPRIMPRQKQYWKQEYIMYKNTMLKYTYNMGKPISHSSN